MNNPEFTYIQVADAIELRINAGIFKGRLPAERDLAKEFGVSYATVRHAMAVLRDEGLIISRQGRGTFAVPARKHS